MSHRISFRSLAIGVGERLVEAQKLHQHAELSAGLNTHAVHFDSHQAMFIRSWARVRLCRDSLPCTLKHLDPVLAHSKGLVYPAYLPEPFLTASPLE